MTVVMIGIVIKKYYNTAMSNFNKEEADINFDLPTVESSAPAKPRVHVASENVCVACEG